MSQTAPATARPEPLALDDMVSLPASHTSLVLSNTINAKPPTLAQVWDRRLEEYMQDLEETRKKPVILCGDLNGSIRVVRNPS